MRMNKKNSQTDLGEEMGERFRPTIIKRSKIKRTDNFDVMKNSLKINRRKINQLEGVASD